jgi:hypothetical protein
MTRIQRVILATLIVALVEGSAAVTILAKGDAGRGPGAFGVPGARGFTAAFALGLSALRG